MASVQVLQCERTDQRADASVQFVPVKYDGCQFQLSKARRHWSGKTEAYHPDKTQTIHVANCVRHRLLPHAAIDNSEILDAAPHRRLAAPGQGALSM